MSIEIPEHIHRQHMAILDPNNIRSLKNSISFPGKILKQMEEYRSSWSGEFSNTITTIRLFFFVLFAN